MVRGRLDPAIEYAHAADVPCVGPELIKELSHARQQEDTDGNAAQGHRHVEDPVGEGAGSGLAQGGGEVELFALVMDGVGGPEETDGVAQAVLPVVTEIVKDEREDPGKPTARRETNRSRIAQQPLVHEETEKAKKHAHAGADDAAAQAVDGVGEVIVAGSADAVDDEFQHDRRDEDWNRQRHRPAIGGIHECSEDHHIAVAGLGSVGSLGSLSEWLSL